MVTAQLLRAFVTADRAYGNPALVVAEPAGARVTPRQRQELADRLGVPATVFVWHGDGGRVSIHGSYGQEIRFGGHPLLATVEALHGWGRLGEHVEPSAGRVACRRDADGWVWLTAPAAWSKPWRHYRMDTPAQIDALTGLPDGEDFTQVWAWIDEPAGRVRARLWAPRIGKGEDEACGSASMILARDLGRPLDVVHGTRGALIRTRPVDGELVELGGRCVADDLDPAMAEEIDRLYR